MRAFPDSRLKGEANLLIMPTLDAANIAFNLLKVAAGGGVTLGPILLGVAKPVHILTPSATVRRIVNMTALTVVDASVQRQRIVAQGKEEGWSCQTVLRTRRAGASRCSFAASFRLHRPRSRRRGRLLRGFRPRRAAARRPPRPPHVRPCASLGLDLRGARTEAPAVRELRRLRGRLRPDRGAASRRRACEIARRMRSPTRRASWFADPDGTPVQLVVAPQGVAGGEDRRGAGAAVAARRAAPRRRARRPARCGRAGCRTCCCSRSDVPRSVRFYADALGLRLSDHSGDIIAFLHGAHASDHHLIAFAKSDGPGLHHSSWDVGDASTTSGSACEQMIDRGLRARLGRGPARARLELLLLRARSVGQLRRVLVRHRLHPGRRRLAGGRSSARGFVLRLGAAGPRRLHQSITSSRDRADRRRATTAARERGDPTAGKEECRDETSCTRWHRCTRARRSRLRLRCRRRARARRRAADPHRQHAGADRAARRDRPRPQARRRDLRRAAEQARTACSAGRSSGSSRTTSRSPTSRARSTSSSSPSTRSTC